MIDYYRIELPYAVFALEVEDDRITYAAPIGRWMIGKNLTFIENWVSRKKGNITRLLVA